MTVVVFPGGDAPPPAVVAHLPEGATVIAADHGLDHATALGVEVHHVVGDMDSVDPDLLGTLPAGVAVDRHPTDKDATDLELALEVALAVDPESLLVVGGHGGRTDHFLANALLLADRRYAHVAVTWLAGHDVVHVVHDAVTVGGTPGSTVSLIPLTECAGVTTDGLAWRLDGVRLDPGTTRGVSNALVATEATVSVASGSLLVVRPGALDPPPDQE